MRRFLYPLLLAVCAGSLLAETYLVVPFANRTGDANLDWVGESFSERIRETLVTNGSSVASREDRDITMKRLGLARPAQHSLASAIKIAEALGCDRVLYGSFEITKPVNAGTSRGVLRVTARVADRVRLAQLGEFSGTGPLESLDGASADLAWSVLRWVQPANPITLEAFRRSHSAVKVTALENYLRGLMAPSPEQKHWFFTQAVRNDPEFDHPCYYLGRMHYDKENYPEAVKWLAKVAPDHPDYVTASFLLGLSYYEVAKYALAITAFEHVAAFTPTPEVWNNLGAALVATNDSRGLDTLRKALNADPTDPDYHFNVGYVLWQQGAFDEAATEFRAVLDRNTSDDDATLLLGHALQRTGPRPGDLRIARLERLKDTFDPPAARQPDPASR